MVGDSEEGHALFSRSRAWCTGERYDRNHWYIADGRESGKKIRRRNFVDSSAALAVVARKGTGKLRHVRVGQLWVQELAENDEVKFKKVKGEENPQTCAQSTLSEIRWTHYWNSLAYVTGKDEQMWDWK